MKHTKGPWSIDFNGENNAKLIALAPEMLDVLETISIMHSGNDEETTISERLIKSMCDDVIKKLK